MYCVYCGEKTRTINSRRAAKGYQTWRRRKCETCGAIFTTDEVIDMELAIRVKKASGLEPFISEKLLLDVYNSLSHRKTAYADAKSLTATIVSALIPCETGVVSSPEIKEAVLKVLKRFDKAAFTYYKARHS